VGAQRLDPGAATRVPDGRSEENDGQSGGEPCRGSACVRGLHVH
jgi:hypothetical protein